MPICGTVSAVGLEFGFGGLIGGGEVDEVGDCCCCDMKKSQVKRHEVTTSSAYGIQSVTYRECQKNHAAGVGGYAVDGCREFMASGGEGTGGALVCAACGCHRSFHRREMDTEVVCSERFASR